MASDARGPEVVEDLALGAFRLVKERLQIPLDFTPETLPLLDHYLLELREEPDTAQGGNGRDAAPEPPLVALVGPCAGAYFGEVCRRSLPGLAWAEHGEDYAAWRLEGADGEVHFNPVGVALEALHRGPVQGFAGHFEVAPAKREAVDQALRASGPVREDDYYRLAVRHEVLEQTLGVLGRG